MNQYFITQVKEGKIICHRCKEAVATEVIDIGDAEIALCSFCFDSITTKPKQRKNEGW